MTLKKKKFCLRKGPSINDVGNWEGGGVKNWSKLPTDSTKKLPTWGRGVSKIRNNHRPHLWMVPNCHVINLAWLFFLFHVFYPFVKRKFISQQFRVDETRMDQGKLCPLPSTRFKQIQKQKILSFTAGPLAPQIPPSLLNCILLVVLFRLFKTWGPIFEILFFIIHMYYVYKTRQLIWST